MKFDKLIKNILAESNKDLYTKDMKNELSETVTISKKEYDLLIKDARLLAFLEATGVENWSGWDFAVKEMEKEA
jgi:hypothetical protein